jgi:SAM-dependent methyltransferase
MQSWVPTPTFLYRNYLYKQIVKKTPRNTNVLLIGTGNGYFAKWLSKNKFKGVAIDISKEAVLFTKKELRNNKNIKVLVVDLFKYNPQKKFDLVLCFEVIEHIENDKKALKKIHDLMVPGGEFVMSVPAHMSEWAKIDEIGGHFRRYERKELTKKMENVGFKINIFWSYGFPFLRVVRWISRSGKFVKNFNYDKKVDKRIKKSGIRLEYDPRLKKLVTNSILLTPLFKFMDLFLNSDLGLGYIVEVKKPL